MILRESECNIDSVAKYLFDKFKGNREKIDEYLASMFPPELANLTIDSAQAIDGDCIQAMWADPMLRGNLIASIKTYFQYSYL